MKYIAFSTEQEAVEAEAAICVALGYPKMGINAMTGTIAADKQQTTRWCVPSQIRDGRWVIASQADGVEPGADWWPTEP
eukprot:scaffold18728_cov121-Isochrysis_galbana.AAC.2